ncbi:hypothetical protein [Solirubrobacter soli]|nr:hypothetical protein [Solirubrobacter soli]
MTPLAPDSAAAHPTHARAAAHGGLGARAETRRRFAPDDLGAA